jgi:hypothetical protein
MAKKTRARRGGGKSSRTTTNLKKSLRDAQAVFARYFESGGKRVKETFDSLTEIFESKHLGDALRVAPVGDGRSSRPSRRRAAARTRTTQRAGTEKRAAAARKRTARE